MCARARGYRTAARESVHGTRSLRTRVSMVVLAQGTQQQPRASVELLPQPHIRHTRVCLMWTEIGPLVVSVMGRRTVIVSVMGRTVKVS